MSRAFVKESDNNSSVSDLPERPQSPYTNYVTRSGLEQIRQRIKDLLAQKAALNKEDGDLSAQTQRAAIERDLRYYEAREESAELVDPALQDAAHVHFGATVVVVADTEDRQQTFSIVGEDEADAEIGKISWISPLAKALLNARVGEHVTWPRPLGDLDLRLLSIHKADA
ncbi:transcription elongation factor GreAB [Candidatus Methylospira mobilis]|uniref:Transcription elongation factor GreAB n=1 Tax=Candidatus Methylospira mobilis TaxID=1808979 RepID=A0A5Q0BPI7_9GAMM|nr:GreA/GreB family elongation factor [Candidatus Methylospira mobilis]QFY43987.1 transcription elongation factor GreAB [Candidatus Methylospira mobilis]WNV04988.1 GreA/GreB family elongation factor [Candidatus Methylospira mobilis]